MYHEFKITLYSVSMDIFMLWLYYVNVHYIIDNSHRTFMIKCHFSRGIYWNFIKNLYKITIWYFVNIALVIHLNNPLTIIAYINFNSFQNYKMEKCNTWLKEPSLCVWLRISSPERQFKMTHVVEVKRKSFSKYAFWLCKHYSKVLYN